MLMVNIDRIPGVEFEVLGMVEGSVVLAKDAASDFVAGVRSIVGGEITEYTKMLAQARVTALNRMEAEAERLCADAVVNVRYGTAAIMDGAAEIIAYGTAISYK